MTSIRTTERETLAQAIGPSIVMARTGEIGIPIKPQDAFGIFLQKVYGLLGHPNPLWRDIRFGITKTQIAGAETTLDRPTVKQVIYVFISLAELTWACAKKAGESNLPELAKQFSLQSKAYSADAENLSDGSKRSAILS